MKKDFEKHHTYQNLPHTCGPTCLKTVLNYYGEKNIGFSSLINYTGCNELNGTIGSGIENALKKLNLKFIRNPYKNNFDKSVTLLNEVNSPEQLFLMRTMTKNVKHWIVVYGKIENTYLISDPWLGLNRYTTNMIQNIWRPRMYDGFLIKK